MYVYVYLYVYVSMYSFDRDATEPKPVSEYGIGNLTSTVRRLTIKNNASVTHVPMHHFR